MTEIREQILFGDPFLFLPAPMPLLRHLEVLAHQAAEGFGVAALLLVLRGVVTARDVAEHFARLAPCVVQ